MWELRFAVLAFFKVVASSQIFPPWLISIVVCGCKGNQNNPNSEIYNPKTTSFPQCADEFLLAPLQGDAKLFRYSLGVALQ